MAVLQRLSFFFCLLALFSACAVFKKKSSVSDKKEQVRIDKGKKNAVQAYIMRYQDIAKGEMACCGIPASITMAQGILESGSGQSALTRKANNHFGIKCHNSWKGKGYYMDDDRPNECFRVYPNAEASYKDHSKFLQGKRYQFLYNYDINDYRSWAYGLKKAGYATNPKYPQLLISLIEQYSLHLLDQGKQLTFVGYEEIKPEKSTDYEGSHYLIDQELLLVKEAPLFKINFKLGKRSKKAKLETKEKKQKKKNAKPKTSKQTELLNANTIVRQEGNVPSNDKPLSHIVVKGDTLYSLSKKYGVSVEKIIELNGIENNTIKIGEKLIIRK